MNDNFALPLIQRVDLLLNFGKLSPHLFYLFFKDTEISDTEIISTILAGGISLLLNLCNDGTNKIYYLIRKK